MKTYFHKLTYLASLLVISFLFVSFADNDNIKNKILLRFLDVALKMTHYEPKQVNDELSEKMFQKYLEKIDFFKLYITQEEFDELEKFKFRIDDDLLEYKFDFYYNSKNSILRGYNRAKNFVSEILSNPLAYNKEEVIKTKAINISFSKNEKELKDRWRKRLKYQLLSQIYDEMELQKKKSEDSLRSTKYEIFSFEDIEQKERVKLKKNYKNFFKKIEERKDLDWLHVYLNTFAESFDPHTTYFLPRDKEYFDVSMSGKYEGIGARLREEGGFITIVELIPGGPSYRQGLLEVDDAILKVGQGDEEPIDIVGMSTEEAIKYIKGKKGTLVKLTVRKASGMVEVIPITRDIVELEETFAKSSVVQKENKKFGIIHLPKFYFDEKNRINGRHSSNDVKKEIERLKESDIEGLILDLRNNTGGYLKEAVKIAGLFIERGPVVQVRNKERKSEVLKDNDKRVYWDGPLLVLVNEFSASASEILAASLQDYGRAIIVGSEHTFGKGTVQGFLNLDNYARSDIINNLGSLGFVKVTMQKYYRVNGKSTQLKGVISDIELPSSLMYTDTGEEEEVNALKWDQIGSVSFSPWKSKLEKLELEKKSELRIKNSKYFSLLKDRAEFLKKKREVDTIISLRFEDFKKELDESKDNMKKYYKLKEYRNNIEFFNSNFENLQVMNDSVLAKNRSAWHKNMKKDAYIEESISILKDMTYNSLSLN